MVILWLVNASLQYFQSLKVTLENLSDYMNACILVSVRIFALNLKYLLAECYLPPQLHNILPIIYYDINFLVVLRKCTSEK